MSNRQKALEKAFPHIIEKVINKINPKGLPAKLHTINMEGMPASHIDLGKLQMLIAEEGKKKNDITKKQIDYIITNAVERVKSIEIIKNENKWPSWAITFKTKDDFGWYTYEFSVAERWYKDKNFNWED